VTDPEAARLLHAIYGIDVPPTPRNDLVAIFLTGITGLNKPQYVKPSEELRLNVATPVTASPNRMGVLGGDNQGFPNGRRLGDDVIDIALQAVAGGTPFHPSSEQVAEQSARRWRQASTTSRSSDRSRSWAPPRRASITPTQVTGSSRSPRSDMARARLTTRSSTAGGRKLPGGREALLLSIALLASCA